MDSRAATALKQDTPDYRLLHSCPPCQYKLEDEPELEYDLLLAIDGNNSLKRFASASSHLDPSFNSDYYIPPADVELLAHEVVHRAPAKKKKKTTTAAGTAAPAPTPPAPVATAPAAAAAGGDEDVAMELEAGPVHVTMAGQIDASGQIDGDPTGAGLDEIVGACVERWKAAAEESKKTMFKCFEESGVFLGACHHGFILKVIDMIMSGEL